MALENHKKYYLAKVDTDEFIEQWLVEGGQYSYVVTQILDDPLHKCNFFCEECRNCIHQLVCTCPQYRVKALPCVHMHVLGLNKNSRYRLIEESTEATLPMDVENNENSDIDNANEVEGIFESQSSTEPLTDPLTRSFSTMILTIKQNHERAKEIFKQIEHLKKSFIISNSQSISQIIPFSANLINFFLISLF
jgi:hypothetical protein